MTRDEMEIITAEEHHQRTIRRLFTEKQQLEQQLAQAQTQARDMTSEAQAAIRDYRAAQEELAQAQEHHAEHHQQRLQMKYDQARALLEGIEHILTHDVDWHAVTEWRDQYRAFLAQHPT